MKNCKTRHECIEWLKEHPLSVAPQQHVTVDYFKPEDAEGVAKLYYAIYGDTFAIDYVYNPTLISEANAGDDLHQIVAKTGSGDIVGLVALFKVSAGKGILESGGMMILPEYRYGGLIARMVEMMLQLAKDQLKLHTVYGQSVTDHVASQKIARRSAGHTYAIELECMPSRPGQSGPRITLINHFSIFREIPHAVSLPDAYASFLRNLYAEMNLTRTCLPGVPPSGTTKSTVLHMEAASLSKLLVTEIGKDFSEKVQAMETTYPGSLVYHLQIPLFHPGLPTAVSEARALGYSLGGLLPLWLDKDVLLMQKLAEKPDFSTPKLLTEQTRKLYAAVQADWEYINGQQSRPALA